jgi:hypothetical protein
MELIQLSKKFLGSLLPKSELNTAISVEIAHKHARIVLPVVAISLLGRKHYCMHLVPFRVKLDSRPEEPKTNYPPHKPKPQFNFPSNQIVPYTPPMPFVSILDRPPR